MFTTTTSAVFTGKSQTEALQEHCQRLQTELAEAELKWMSPAAY